MPPGGYAGAPPAGYMPQGPGPMISGYSPGGASGVPGAPPQNIAGAFGYGGYSSVPPSGEFTTLKHIDFTPEYSTTGEPFQSFE